MAESITLQTSDNNVLTSDVLGRLSFAASSESSGSDAVLVSASIYAQAEAEFTSTENPTSIIFATSNDGSLTSRIKIDNSGNILPITNNIYNVGSNLLRFANLFGASGNFSNSIKVNGVEVSVSGHSHSASNISDFNSAVLGAMYSGVVPLNSGLFVKTRIDGTLQSTTLSSNDIIDFNSSVSGLLPVTNILGGSNITVSQSGTAFTVAVTGSLGLTTEEVDDRVAALLVAGSGISINYNDPSNTLTISSSAVPVIVKGYEVLSSSKTTFTVPEGYSVGYLDVYFNGTKLVNGLDYTATNGSSFSLSESAISGDTVEWIGTNSYSSYLPFASEQIDDEVAGLLVAGTGISLTYNDNLNTLIINTSGLQPSGNYAASSHIHTASDITNFNSSVSQLLSKTFAIFTATNNQPPLSNFATIDTRNSILVLDFDDALVESAVFMGVVPEGLSFPSGIQTSIGWIATSATSGNVRWRVEFEKGNTDYDADSFDTSAEGNGTANATAGIPITTNITTTSIDSLVAGDLFRLKVSRVGNDATNDTMAGDAELVAIELRRV